VKSRFAALLAALRGALIRSALLRSAVVVASSFGIVWVLSRITGNLSGKVAVGLFIALLRLLPALFKTVRTLSIVVFIGAIALAPPFVVSGDRRRRRRYSCRCPKPLSDCYIYSNERFLSAASPA